MSIVNIKSIVVVIFFFITAPVCGQKGVLVMKNGDRLTCDVKGLNGGVLDVSIDYVDGTVSVDWAKVARIESNLLLILRTQDGSTYTGRVSTAEAKAGESLQIEVAETAGEKVVLDSSQIIGIYPTAEKFLDRLNGDISLGFTYAKGNQATQLNLSSTVEYPTDRWLAKVDFSSIRSSSTGVDASTRNQIGLSGFRLLRRKNYFYTGGFNFLQSSAQGVSSQTTFGGGIGRFLKNTNQTRIYAVAGAAWQRTKYEQSNSPLGTQNAAAALIKGDVKVSTFKKTKLSADANLLPVFSEPGRVFFRGNASYYLKIFGDLSWNISLYGNWDNRPPSGLSGSDYGSSTGLTWSFGNW